jgi:uncharacterized protein (DUF2252 family)
MTTTAPLAESIPTAAARAAAGKALRERVARSKHSGWTAPAGRDPLSFVAATAAARIPALVPLRNARMAQSPFAFYRGSADIMAADLAQTPVTGLHVQLCGDAHCLNFGAYATPERRLIFDVTDFDETVPGPWEWDVKRLAASLVLAARSINLKGEPANITVLSAVRTYRQKMLEFAAKTALETWYARLDAASLVGETTADERRRRKAIVDSAEANTMRAAVEKTTLASADGRRFREEPPLLYHAASPLEGGGFDIEEVIDTYTASLTPEIRGLLGRYRLIDHAVKVVGVGSVGTRCAVALMQADVDDLLILQIKEAAASVLERFTGPSIYGSHGERVVHGQRLMQAAADALLGWGKSCGRDFYVRQYKDKKGTVNVAAMDGFGLRGYAEMCGWTLARAHARSGDAAQIAGYLGRGDTFERAIVRFGSLYADQAEQDYAAFRAAIDAGKIPVAAATGTANGVSSNR